MCPIQVIWQLSCTKAPKVAEGKTLRLVLILVGLHKHIHHKCQAKTTRLKSTENHWHIWRIGRDQKPGQPQLQFGLVLLFLFLSL
jgi:hypothetical protein